MPRGAFEATARALRVAPTRRLTAFGAPLGPEPGMERTPLRVAPPMRTDAFGEPLRLAIVTPCARCGSLQAIGLWIETFG